MQQRPETERTGRVLAAALAIVAAAVALRGWLALSDHSVFWPDEIHQSVEQAHRAVFGYGLLSWEFRDGARSWLFPGAIAGLWKLADALGIQSSIALVTLARLAMVLGSGVAIVFAAKLAAASRNPRAGLATAVLLATFPPAVAFSYRTMSETASAPLIVLGAWFWRRREKHSGLYAGLALAAACLLRYQNGIFVLVFGAALLLQRRWREVAEFLAAGAMVSALGGALDWITWGRPFHSLLAYIDFNLVLGGASTFGVEPFGYYAATLWSSVGPLLPVVLACFAVGAFVEPVLGGAVLAYVFAHSVLPHKEFRFLVPCLPLFATVVGIGVARILSRVPAPRLVGSAAAVVATFSFAFVLRHLDYEDMGQYQGTERATASVWHSEEEPTLLLADAGQRSDLCGVAVLRARAAFTGGYTYLHRDVPLIYERDLCSAAPANYVVGPIESASQLPSAYTLATRRGGWGLYRREGGCDAPEAFDDMLEGARDMGLVRDQAHQAEDGALRFNLVRDSGAFASGWGNGELLDCDMARWVVGAHAAVEFEFEPGGPQYLLNVRARAHERATPQRFAIAINGKRIHVGPMSPQLQTYSIELPDDALRAGKNRLDLAFARTAPADVNDHRELAALFRSIEIVPREDDFNIDMAQSDARRHLLGGFNPSERVGDATFAWSNGPISEVEGILAWPRSPYVLTTVAEAVPLVPSQRTRIFVNDQLIGSLAFRPHWSTESLAVPATALRKGRNLIRFEYEATVRPAEVSRKLSDHRELAVRFSRIELSPMPAARVVDFGTPAARRYLLDGWSGDEVDGERTVVWSSGPSASAVMSFEGVEQPVLRLTAQGYRPALPINVTVVVDGAAAATFAAPDGWQDLAIPLAATDPSKSGQIVTLEFDRTGKPSDANPKVDDHRSLALRVDRIWIDAPTSAGDGTPAGPVRVGAVSGAALSEGTLQARQ